jgi:hypothetical protein
VNVLPGELKRGNSGRTAAVRETGQFDQFIVDQSAVDAQALILMSIGDLSAAQRVDY